MAQLLLFIAIFALIITLGLKTLFHPIQSWQRLRCFSRKLLSPSSPPSPVNNRQPFTTRSRFIVTTSLAFLGAVLSLVIALPYLPVLAEGSQDLINSGGDRPWLEDRVDTTAGINRTNILKVYARAGETINLGSSAVGLGSGDILFRSPTGSTAGSCLNDVRPAVAPADWGRIDNLGEEQAGPLPAAGGYIPCVITVTAATEGVWEIEFTAPNPNSDPGINPPQLAAAAPWTQANDRFWIAAWDITVMSNTTPIDGRVFANYLPMNLSTFAGSFDSEVFILTNDGYQYQVDLNGQQPFGFVFFANSVGFIDTTTGDSLYRSVQLNTGAPVDAFLGSEGIHSPTAPDTGKSITHKIFFNLPDPTMPEAATAMMNGQVSSTWLLTAPIDPPTVTGFGFVGIDGTPGQAGTTGGGDFIFDANGSGNATIVLDLNQNGTPGDGNDRVLQARVTAGSNSIFWDSRDGNGDLLPLSPIPVCYDAFIRTVVGEVHFPFFDVENNINGFIIERLNGPNSPDATVYFDDRVVGGGSTNLVTGIDSSGGAHNFSGGFGDHKGIDTWTYRAGDFVFQACVVTLTEADLQVQKIAPATIVAGQSITYTILVTNAGPSAAAGAPIEDTLPPQVVNATWSCQVIAGPGVCGPPASGSGNITTTVDLSPNGRAVFTVVGQVLPNASGTIQNSVSISPGPDTTDPITSNNSSTATTTVIATPAVIGVAKAASIPVNNGNGTFSITYTVVVRNYGGVDLANVQVIEDLSTVFGPPASFSVLPPPPNVVGGLSLGNAAFNGVGNNGLLAGTETLVVGGSATITFRLLVTPSTNLGPYTNTVTAVGVGPNGPVTDVSDDGANPDGNGDGDPTNDNDPTTVLFPAAGPQLQLTKLALPVGQTLEPGDVITYILTYQNNGAGPATGVVITDIIPSNTTYLPGSATPGPGALFFVDDNGLLQPTQPAIVTGLHWEIGTVPANSGPQQVSFAVQINTILVSSAGNLTVQYSPQGWIVLKGDPTGLPLVEPLGPSTITTSIPSEATPAITPSPTLTPPVDSTPLPTGTTIITPAVTAEPTAEPTVTLTPALTSEPTSEPAPDNSPAQSPDSGQAGTATPVPTAEPTVEPTMEPTVEPTAEPTVEPTAEPAAEPTTEGTPTARLALPTWFMSAGGLALSIVNQTILPPQVSFQAQITATASIVETATPEPAAAPAVVVSPTEPAPATPPSTLVISANAAITATSPAAEAAVDAQSYPVVILEAVPINIRNSAVIDSNETPPISSTNTTNTPVLRVVDPSLTKEASRDQAVAGDIVDFALTLSNPSASNAPATEVILTDPLPAYLELLDYNFSSAPPGLVTGDAQVENTVTINGIQTIQYTIILTIPALSPGEQVFLTIQTRVKDFVQGPLRIRNEAVMEFAEGAPKIAAVRLRVPDPNPSSSNRRSDSSDDDDDGSAAPTPPPPPLPQPAAPVIQPAPTLPVIFLPETGWRETQAGSLAGGAILFGLMVIGVCVSIVLIRKKNKP